jgi:hypothetical protein
MYEVYVSVTALIKQISSGRRYRGELCGAVPAILADPDDDIALAAATDAGKEFGPGFFGVCRESARSLHPHPGPLPEGEGERRRVAVAG